MGACDVSSADNVGGPNRDETGAKGKWSMLAIISQHLIGKAFDPAAVFGPKRLRCQWQ